MLKKNWIQISLLAATLLLVTTAGIFIQKDPASSALAANAEYTADTITVQGIGSVSASPDWSILEAQSTTAEIMARIKTAILEEGVDENHIRTVDFSIHPNYRYDSQGGRKLEGYTVRHILQVEYGDIENVGKLMDQAAIAGANRIDNVRFKLKNNSDQEMLALRKAVEHARKKAETLAQAANKQIVSIHQIIETNANIGIPFAATASMEAADAAGTRVEPGQIDILKNIHVIFIIK